MTKKLKQTRKVVLAVLAIELIISIIYYVVFLTPISFTLMLYIMAKNVILLFAIMYIYNVIEKNNISVKEALSEDAQNIYIYGGLGLIMYDEYRNISWVSDLFQAMDIDIIGEKVVEWQPQLSSLFEEDDVKVIDINSRKYEVYNNSATRLLYLKDITDYSNIVQEFNDQQVCVAYITIDNYDESIERADEQKTAAIQSTSRQIILDWATSNGIMIKRYKSDSYIAAFTERIYRKQVEEKFKILDYFKSELKKLDEVMSLSMGIGRGSKVLRELDAEAFSALSLSFSRGGDQICVKTIDEPIRYFGGSSQSFEKNNRVRARVIAQTLIGIIKSADNIFIMGHKESDFDSLGGSLAINAICESYGKDTKIVIDMNSIEDKTKTVVKELMKDKEHRKMFITGVEANERRKENSLLIVVDNHKPSLVIDIDLLDNIDNVVVIDHHRRGEEFIELPILTYLESSASSTVELIVELYEYIKNDLNISKQDATIMYTGMLIDTNYFKTRVGARTFQVAAMLKDLQADINQAYEYLEDDYQTTIDKLSITQNSYQFGDGILIAFGDEDRKYDRTLLAKAGNELMSVSGVQAAFVVGKVNEGIGISARSGKNVNVQLIMEKLGGGGHFSMAATQLEGVTQFEAINKLEEKINEYLDERMGE